MKKIISIMIVVLLILSSCFVVFAQIPNNEESFLKIDDTLKEKLEQSNNDDIISVWVWFNDVDEEVFENAKADARASSGFDENAYSYTLTKQERKVFENTKSIDDKEWVDSFNNALDSYSKRTASDREEYNKKYRDYQSTFRQKMSEIFTERNTKIKNDLGIDDSEVQFLSTLTPVAIINVPKSKIIELADSENIQYINYYEEVNLPEPALNLQDYTSYINRTHINITRDIFSASGSGINVLMNDSGLIQSNELNDNVLDPTKVYNVVSQNIYPANYSIPNYTNPETHQFLVLKGLQQASPDVTVYCTVRHRYLEMELVISQGGIDIINGSVNYGFSDSYYSDFTVKWFDYITSRYDIPLIASAGNDESWANQYELDNFPLVISPASGYNSIAVGSCLFHPLYNMFKMQNYCYAQPNVQYIVKYKPDIVLNSPHTSGAAPLLSGAIALMLEKFPTLKEKPELIKAIVMASCHKKALPATGNDLQEQLFDGLTLKQGAGIFDAYTSMCIAALGNYRTKIYSEENYNNDFDITPNSDSNINVSLVWFRNNSVPDNHSVGTINDVTVESLNHLQLSVLNNNNLLFNSDRYNTYKQLAYFSVNKNTSYNIRVTKSLNTDENVKYACAWSSDATKCFDNVEITGNKVAVGQTLTANTYYLEGGEVSEDELSYQWQKSADEISWNNITSANEKSYVMAGEDQSKYLRCVVTPKSSALSSYIQLNDSVNDVVVRYGDVNNDGYIDALDATMINKHLLGMITLTEDQIRAGDVDGNGIITNDDQTLILQYCVDIISSFPVEANP